MFRFGRSAPTELALSDVRDGTAEPRWLSGLATVIPSVGDLRRKSEVTDDEIAAAATAYL